MTLDESNEAENWAALFDMQAQSKRKISRESTAFVVVMHLEKLHAARLESAIDADPGLIAIRREMIAILGQHGRAGREGPPRFCELWAASEQKQNAIHAEIYEEAGQATLAKIISRGQLAVFTSNAAPIFAREMR